MSSRIVPSVRGGGGGGGLEVEHNDVLVGSEAGMDFEDSSTLNWSLADDPGGNRVKVSGSVPLNSAIFSGISAIGFKAEAPFTITLMNTSGNTLAPLGQGSPCLLAEIFPYGFPLNEVLTGMVVMVTRWGVTAGASLEQLAICDSTGKVVAVTGNIAASLATGGTTRQPVKLPFTFPYTVDVEGKALFGLWYSNQHWGTQPLIAEYTGTFYPISVAPNQWFAALGASPPVSLQTFATGAPIVGQIVNLNAGNEVPAPTWLGLY